MTDQIPPVENDSLTSRSSTSNEAEDPASRIVSVVTLWPAVLSDPTSYQTATASLLNYNHATDRGKIHSADGNAAGPPQLLEPTNPNQAPSQECIDKLQSFADNNRGTILHCWWREIVANMFSIKSMALVLVLVLKINYTALGYWNFHVGSLPIQPNTLISILTTGWPDYTSLGICGTYCNLTVLRPVRES